MKFLSETIVLVAGIASRIVLTELFRWHTSLRLPTAIGVGCCSALEKSRENLTVQSQETQTLSNRLSNATCVKTLMVGLLV